MAQIFISYSRRDAELAQRLAQDLGNAGIQLWFDQTGISAGTKWSSAIQEALNTCTHMIVVLSPDSMSSQNVEDEWQYFLDVHKPIIPVLVRPADVHFQLRRIQYVDFHTQPYEAAYSKLCKELSAQGVSFAPAQEASPANPIASLTPIRSAPKRLYWGAGVLFVVLTLLGIALLIQRTGQKPPALLDGKTIITKALDAFIAADTLQIHAETTHISLKAVFANVEILRGDYRFVSPDRFMFNAGIKVNGQETNLDVIVIGKDQWYRSKLITENTYRKAVILGNLQDTEPATARKQLAVLIDSASDFVVQQDVLDGKPVYRLKLAVNSRFLRTILFVGIDSDTAQSEWIIGQDDFRLIQATLMSPNGATITMSVSPYNMPLVINAPMDLPLIEGWYAALLGQRCVQVSSSGAAPTTAQLDLVKRSSVHTALLLTRQAGQGRAAIDALKGVGVTRFVFMLIGPEPTPILNQPADFLGTILPILKEYTDALAPDDPLVFVIGNTPNIKGWGWGDAWKNGKEYVTWWTPVITALRQRYPSARIGFPALSVGKDIAGLRQIDESFAAEAAGALNAADFVAVNYFWAKSDGSDMALPIARWKTLAGDKPVIAIEVGPAENNRITADAMKTAYNAFADVNVPACAFVLSGAGSWTNAAWDVNDIIVP